jgi:hypothetical protein
VDSGVVADDVEVRVGVAVPRDEPVAGWIEAERVADAVGDVAHGCEEGW